MPSLLVLAASLLAAAPLPPAAPARRAPTGFEVAWRARLDGAPLPPVAAAGRILAATAYGDLLALDPATGERLVSARSAVAPTHVLVAGAAWLLLAADGGFELRDPETLGPIASGCLPAALEGAPIAAGETTVVPLADGSLAALAGARDRPAWRLARAGPSPTLLALDAGHVLLAGGDGSLAVIAAADGRVLARASATARDGATAGAGAGLVLVGAPGGRVEAFDPRTLKRHWSAELGGGLTAAPVPLGRDLVAAVAANQLVRLRRSGSPVWRAALAGRVRHAPVVDAGEVLVAPERLGLLVAYDAESGAEVRRLTLGEGFARAVGPPVPAGGLVAIATSRSELLAVRRAGAAAPVARRPRPPLSGRRP